MAFNPFKSGSVVVAILLVGEVLTASARNWATIIQNLLQIQERGSGTLGIGLPPLLAMVTFGEEHGGKMKELNCCTTASKCIPVAIWLDSETLCSRLLSGKERKTWLAITLFLFLQTRVHLMGPNQVGRCFVML